MSSLPQDLTSDDLAFFDDASEGDINLFDIGDGDGENTQKIKVPEQVASSSNIFVNPEFSDNSKITYILQYGGGAVV